MNFILENLLRNNIKKLIPYSSARNEYKTNSLLLDKKDNSRDEIFLDANENSFGSPLEKNYNRYPDPLQLEVKAKIAKMKNINPENIFLGNGSDEAIDILLRSFCNPQKDNIIICPPTYGMYEILANINDIEVVKAPLTESFDLNVDRILKAINQKSKLLFICHPNNPSGNLMSIESIKKILNFFNGMVVVDEAYIDFSDCESLVGELKNYPNLVILQTFSKAWGLAGLRIGMALASKEIIDIFNKVKPIYNISSISQQTLLIALENKLQVDEIVKKIIIEREKLISEISKLKSIIKVYPSKTNFILVKANDVNDLYKYLVEKKIVVRNRNNITLCEGCLRITIGNEAENKILLEALSIYNAN